MSNLESRLQKLEKELRPSGEDNIFTEIRVRLVGTDGSEKTLVRKDGRWVQYIDILPEDVLL